MAQPRLRVGLVGLGRLGRIYARDLATRIPEVRLTAVADTNAETAEQIAREYEIARAHTSPDDLIQDVNVDAVVIASPTHTHCDSRGRGRREKADVL